MDMLVFIARRSWVALRVARGASLVAVTFLAVHACRDTSTSPKDDTCEGPRIVRKWAAKPPVTGFAVSNEGTLLFPPWGPERGIREYLPDGSSLPEWTVRVVGKEVFPVCLHHGLNGNYYIRALSEDEPHYIIVVLGRNRELLRSFPHEALDAVVGVGLAADSAGNVFVVHQAASQVLKYAPDGVPLSVWGRFGTAPGEFQYPFDVAVDGFGSVFVSDTGNSRVQRFDASGEYLAEYWGTDLGNGHLHSPLGLAVDGAGVLYVVDPYAYRVQRFLAGRALQPFDTPVLAYNPYDRPNRIAVQGPAVYVGYEGAQTVVCFEYRRSSARSLLTP